MAISPKDLYPSQIDTTDATGYPYGKAQDITSPGDGSGTPLKKEWVNDLWGFFQAALGAEFVTPSGSPDKVGASQILDAILARAKRDFAVTNWRMVQPNPSSFVGSGDYFRGAGFATHFQFVSEFYDTIVAVGDDGSIYFSLDAGSTWGPLSPAGSYSGDFNDVEWLSGLSLWCAVGQNGELQTSADLITWTKRSLSGSPTGDLEKVIWCEDLSLAMVVGEDGGIWTSANGTSWTKQTPAGGYGGGLQEHFLSVAWSPALSLFVAVGNGPEIQTSPDGVTWTSRANTGAYRMQDVAWSPELGIFAISSDDGFDGKILTSSDGVTWVESEITYQVHGIHWSDSLKAFIADGSGYDLEHRGIYVSTNGVDWTLHYGTASNVYGFVEARGFAVGVGRYGRVYLSGQV